MSLRLLMLVLVYSVFIVIFYISESKKQILKLNNIQKQIVSGVLFGILIVISSTSWGGIPLDNEIIDFASGLVICAGFVYGSLAAIISAVIGALHIIIIARRRCYFIVIHVKSIALKTHNKASYFFTVAVKAT